MKASQVIKRLAELIEKYGDQNVLTYQDEFVVEVDAWVRLDNGTSNEFYIRGTDEELNQ